MRFIKGQYNFAKIMIDEIEQTTEEQIKTFLDCPVFKGAKIVIMPDCHAGEGAVIGFTATLNDYIISNIVGVDIACGIESYNTKYKNVNFQELDDFIRENIPHGMNVNKNMDNFYRYSSNEEISSIDSFLTNEILPLCKKISKKDNFYNRVCLSLSSLGGGNHFLELNQAPNEDIWFSIHSGSRNLGKVVAEYHQEKAKKLLEKFFIEDKYKKLEFLPMDMGGSEYLQDMRIVQRYALLNRRHMAKQIICGFFKVPAEEFDNIENIKTMHNFISFEDNIIRKGAISAHNGERVLIPINMKDGIIVGTGKGNKEWNYSAPHGAGRIMGRNQAKKTIIMEDYKDSMEGVWSSCVVPDTIDESPMVYKPIETILSCIQDSVNVNFVMKSIYSFKSCEKTHC